MNSVNIPNVGFKISGSQTQSGVSDAFLFLGKDNQSSFEGFGFGSQNRPDELNVLQINLTYNSNKKVVINLDVRDLQKIAAENSNFTLLNAENKTKFLNMKFIEVATCEESETQAGTFEEKRRIVLMSDVAHSPSP